MRDLQFPIASRRATNRSYGGSALLIAVLFMLLPIADALNGVLIRQYEIRGIGLVYHFMLLVILIFVVYDNSKSRFGDLELYSLVLITAFTVSALVGGLLIDDFQIASLERVAKIVSTCLFVMVLMRVRQYGLVSEGRYKQLVWTVGAITIAITLIADIAGVANPTYRSGVGKIGFYTGSNESIAIILIVACLMLISMAKKFNVPTMVILLSAVLCLAFAQSKSSYALAVVVLFLFGAIMALKALKKARISHSILLLMLAILLLVAIVGGVILSGKTSIFAERQLSLQLQYGGGIDYYSSGRTTRFSELLPWVFASSSPIQLVHLIFGQGLNFGDLQTFEMDLLDVFMYGGLLVSIVVLYGLTKVCYATIKKRDASISILCLLLVLGYGFFAGHVLNGGASGFYFALLISYMLPLEEFATTKVNSRRLVLFR